MALRFRRLPRIRTLLFATYMAVLLLPVAGIGMLRLYESALIRQTEAELLAQAAVLACPMKDLSRCSPVSGYSWECSHSFWPPEQFLFTPQTKALQLRRQYR